MFVFDDYRIILDAVSFPVMAISPVFDGSGVIDDFFVEYLNQRCTEVICSRIYAGERLTSIHLPLEIDCLALGIRCMKEKRSVTVSCCLPEDEIRYFLTADWVNGSLCVLTLKDVTADRQEDHKAVYPLKGQACQFFSLDKFLSDIAKEFLKKEIITGFMVISIDDLGTASRLLGRATVKKILAAASDILCKFESRVIVPYRIGNDEFFIAVTGLESRDSMVTVCDAVSESFINAGLSITAGISLYPDDASDPENLFKYAELARNIAGKNGKNSMFFFRPQMQERFSARSILKQKLLPAMEHNKFELFFQPQFDIETDRLRGFEALLRWYDDILGWISPDDFIPIAEESRAILRLGQWVLETAAKTLFRWQKIWGFDGIMSVNVSPIQLMKKGFLSGLTEILHRYNIPPGSFEIEITEGIFIDDIDQAVQVLNDVRKLGVLISLDDFGTGYSSFRYFQKIPLTTVKIDRSFISCLISENSIDARIAGSIISLGNRCGFDTIAEGVEYPAQLDILKKMKCKIVQGFLYSRPMDASLCEIMLQSGSIAKP